MIMVEKLQIVERAMQKLSRPDLHPEAVDTAEELLTYHAPILDPPICAATPSAWSTPPIRTAQNPLMTSCSKTGGLPGWIPPSDASTPNANSTRTADGDEHPTLHEG